jgi:hypothetical protein
MKAAKFAQTSHGKDSKVRGALNAPSIEEARVAGDPKTALALMSSLQFQEIYEKLLDKLLAWAEIDESYAIALRD